MDTYVINGVEVEYDTFDLVNLELFQQGCEDIRRKGTELRADGGNSMAVIREMCDAILDFFDLVVGEGTAERCFGSRVNLQTLTAAFRRFVDDVAAKADQFGREYGGPDAFGPAPPPEAPGNREQRRAAERARRRREAEEKARRRKEDRPESFPPA